MRFIGICVLTLALGEAGGQLLAQENLLVQFGRPLPSIATEGKLVHFEDQKSQMLVEVFRILPPGADILSSFILIESVYTTNGVPTGRRLSLFPLGAATPSSNEGRLVTFDFDENERFEAVTFNKNPSTWINLANMPEDRRTGDLYQFLKSILEPLLALEEFPLDKKVTAADLEMGMMSAPRGMLCPQVIRPVFGLEPVSTEVNQTVLTQIERRYSPDSVLTKFDVRVFHLLSEADTARVTHRQTLAMGSNYFVHQSETSTSPLLERARPCRRILEQLKEHEGPRI